MFATLRALATGFPDEAGEGQGSFDQGAEKPEALTAFDRIWLPRLYDGIPNLPASTRLRGVELAKND